MTFLNQKFTSYSVGQVPEDADIVFVADMFVEDGVLGGAELTTDAILEASPYKIFKLRSRDMGQLALQTGANKKWIFGNYSQIPANIFYQVLIAFAENLNYSVVEYDYKYCVARSPEKHALQTGKCDCPGGQHTSIIEKFYAGAKRVYWMSEKQMMSSLKAMPALSSLGAHHSVLSSVFSADTLAKLNVFRDLRTLTDSYHSKDEWAVLSANSWIKGTKQAIEHCEREGLKYRLIGNLAYDDLLTQLSLCKGLVYMPPGGDTCPRLVIEAKLMGLDLILNDNVQHKDEEWFSSVDSCLEYLAGSASEFWQMVRSDMFAKPTVSGYMTTFNALSRGYPLREAISSLGFCDEICIADGGSTDGTVEFVSELKSLLGDKLKVHVFGEQDGLNAWDGPHFAVNDGKLKALAREMCTMQFCWQQDSDEILPESDGAKVHSMLERVPKVGKFVVALPVIEYWGDSGKVRVDVNPWKWRLSPNNDDITHGIPAELRVDSTRSLPGSDGCDMVDREGNRIPLMSFYTNDVHAARMMFVKGDSVAGKNYSEWYQKVTSELPTIHHYSWIDLDRKIRLYRDYWTRHWNSLYGTSLEDTAETNMFFDKPWSHVTDEDITSLAKKLKDTTYGWIWHTKWKGQHTPGLTAWAPDPLGLVKTN